MCGISGYIGTNKISSEKKNACLELMKRRGPDASGTFYHRFKSKKNVYLFHTRLSIIDLDERSNQPFEMDKKVMIFNGELYNYIELKKELISKGHHFKTKSDTEVFLRTLIEFGWQGLDKCEGMWAFAIYDKRDGSLMLCRDRFGEKPLYYLKTHEGLYFGSEVKFVAELTEKKLTLNKNFLYRYMINGYKSLYKTKDNFFSEIDYLPPSSVLSIKNNEIKTFKYWKPNINPDESLTYNEAIERARELLIESVRLRLRSDVPLAFCMSGGVDSNSLISIAKNVFNYDVHGFTIVNTDARYEEQELVNHSVKQLKICHTEVPVTTDNFLKKLRMLIRQHDAPVYTITYYAQWLLMKEIADHGYKISISGVAADELFSGYYDHHNAYLYEIYHNHPEMYNEAFNAWTKHISPIVRNPFLKNPEIFIESKDFRDHIYLNADSFSKFFFEEWSEPFKEEFFMSSLLRNRMLNELFHESVPQILHEDDLNSMYYSIENRSPFLDRKLFDFCSTIPTRHLVKDGAAKAILRDSMRGIAPDKILNERRKVGFNAPILSFLNVSDPDVREYLLDDGPIFEFIKRDKIEELITKQQLPNSESKFLFYFLSTKIFIEELC